MARSATQATFAGVNAAVAQNGAPMFVKYMDKASVQSAVANSAALTGTLSVQYSNDTPPSELSALPSFVPTNWNDAGQFVTLAGAAQPTGIPSFDISCKFIRLVWTPSAGSGNLTASITAKAIGD